MIDTTMDSAGADVSDTIRWLKDVQKKADRQHPRARFLSLAITKLEEAEMWLSRPGDIE